MPELHIRGNKWLIRLFGLLLIFGPIYGVSWYAGVIPIVNDLLVTLVACVLIVVTVIAGGGIFVSTFNNE